MAATTRPTPIKSAPGIRRDGTQLDGDEYIEAIWCRFYRTRPKKINGYIAVTSDLPEKVYGMNSFTVDAINYLAMGGASTLTQAQVNFFGNLVSLDNRTPGALVSDPDNMWQMDTFISAIGGPNSLVAHAAPNLSDISSSTERQIFAGNVNGTGALAPVGMDANSGGIVSIYPYLFGYGNNGRIDISALNDYSINESTFATGQKIVKGLPLRNAGGPAGLFWSLDSVVQATFNAAITTGIPFAFNTVNGQSSILSSQGVLEYDGIYFWMGVDRFLMFNGVVREVPNTYNLDFFFDNINYQYRQKAFAFKVPRWGEIWFCAPLGNATECNHAVIYNVREGVWYDTALPGLGRSNGIFASVYEKPFMTDLASTAAGPSGFTLWQHETGLDQINGSDIQPILSSFTTNELTMADQNQDKALRVDFVEPDLVQRGDLTCTVVGRANARAKDQESQSVTFPEDNGDLDANDQVIRFKKSYRLLRFTFSSNVTGGDYYMGKILGHIEPTDGRITS